MPAPLPRLLLCLLCLTACSPRCGRGPAEPPPGLSPDFSLEDSKPAVLEELPDSDEAVHAFPKEPSPEELQALGIATPPEYQAATLAFRDAFERLAAGKLKQHAAALKQLSANHPWHFLAESAGFASISTAFSLGNCEETVEAGTAFVQAWPNGAYAPEVWLQMAFCQKQGGHVSEFEETLEFIARRYVRSPAGLKAKIELGARHSINELK